jgi:phage baseplate assembly protein W
VTRTGAHIGFPLAVTPQRRTALVDDETYLRGLVEAVIFTRPGERVNRPDFGSGIDQLVFAPSGGELAQATKALVHGALQRALGELMRVEDVAVDAEEATLRVTIVYTPLLGGAPGPERRSLTVSGGPAAGGSGAAQA